MKDFYNVLGVEEEANADTIKAAYRKLVREHHPDKGGDEEKIKEINEAYETLKDSNKRTEYDQARRFGGNQGHGFASAGGFPFDDIFGGGGPFGFNFGFNNPFAQQQQRNQDVNVQMSITFDEAYYGVEKDVSLNFQTGVKQVKIKVPKGVDTGMRLKLSQQGMQLNPSYPPGDIYVTIIVQPHHIFQREAHNLRTTKRISVFDALLGCELTVKNVDGNDIMVKVPIGVQHGNSLRIQGKGMPIVNSSGFGDLYVDIQVEIPKLSSEQLDLIKKVKSM